MRGYKCFITIAHRVRVFQEKNLYRYHLILNAQSFQIERPKSCQLCALHTAGRKKAFRTTINGGLQAAKQDGGSDFEVEQDPKNQVALWSTRKEAVWIMRCLRERGIEVWSNDPVPLSTAPDLVST